MKIHIKSPKRRVVIIVIAILLVLAGLVAVGYSITTRTNQLATESIATTRQTAIDSLGDLNKLLAEGVLPLADKLKSIASFKEKLSVLSDNVCSDAKKTIYYTYLPEHKRCQESKEALLSVQTSIEAIETGINDDGELAKVIPTTTTGLSFQESYELWVTAATNAEKVVVGDGLKDEKAELVLALTGYRDAWKAVVDADADQDETAFVAAEKALGTAHTTLIEVSSGLGRSLDELSNDFKTKFEAFLTKTNAS